MRYILESQKYYVDNICKEYGITNYTVNKDGSIDVHQSIHLKNSYFDNNKKSPFIRKLPIVFNRVYGNFDCSGLGLLTLEGSPSYVEGEFACVDNKLMTLEGSPSFVGNGYYCYNNKLVSLKGVPKKLDGIFSCGHNELISLEGSPSPINKLNLFHCVSNKLISLKGAPICEKYYFDNNQLPKLILDNIDNVKEIIEYQDDYSIWNKDLSLNEYRFYDLLEEIKDNIL